MPSSFLTKRASASVFTYAALPVRKSRRSRRSLEAFVEKTVSIGILGLRGRSGSRGRMTGGHCEGRASEHEGGGQERRRHHEERQGAVVGLHEIPPAESTGATNGTPALGHLVGTGWGLATLVEERPWVRIENSKCRLNRGFVKTDPRHRLVGGALPHEGFVRPVDRLPAHLGHRPLQPALCLLHAPAGAHLHPLPGAADRRRDRDRGAGRGVPRLPQVPPDRGRADPPPRHRRDRRADRGGPGGRRPGR